jgi:hypothetical protein
VKYIFLSSFFPCTTQRAREKSEFFVLTIFTKTTSHAQDKTHADIIIIASCVVNSPSVLLL